MPSLSQTRAVLMRGGVAPTLVITNPDVTPTEGANLLADPGFEDWDSATDLADWAESLSGTSSISREDTVVHSGDYAARADIDSSNSQARLQQTVTLAQYAWFRSSVWATTDTASKSAQMQFSNAVFTLDLPTDDYAQFTGIRWASTANPLLALSRWSSASASLYWDDAEVVQVTPGIALYNHVKNCGRFEMRYTRQQWTAIGLIINADDPDNPKNYTRILDIVAALDNNSTQVIALESVTNGVPTVVATYNYTYSPDAALAVTRHEDGTLDIEYNSVALATGVSATGHAGTYWGAMNTYAGNSISLLSVDSRDCVME